MCVCIYVYVCVCVSMYVYGYYRAHNNLNWERFVWLGEDKVPTVPATYFPNRTSERAT